MAKKKAVKKKPATQSVKPKKAKKSEKGRTVKKKSGRTLPGKGKGKKEDLMCFFTTACVRYLGMSDQCLELETLRRFRDVHLLGSARGRRLVSTYYAEAPGIVAQIESKNLGEQIYPYIYERVQLTCRHIRNARKKEAIDVYTEMFTTLKKLV